MLVGAVTQPSAIAWSRLTVEGSGARTATGRPAVGDGDDLAGGGAIEVLGQMCLELADADIHVVTLPKQCDYITL